MRDMSDYASRLQRVAVPAVCFLIAFLAYTSQILFHYLEPGPADRRQTVLINLLALSIWISYYRAVSIDPGRLPEGVRNEGKRDYIKEQNGQLNWCKKCDAVKPPRSHHCKTCKRCIPKMDHHCPWTSNCTSAVSFPPFLRFLLWAVIGLTYLFTHLYTRASVLFSSKNASYLGPPMWVVVHLIVLLALNALTLFILAVLFVTSCHGLAFNYTMIEKMEMETHKKLWRRAKKNGGYVSVAGGRRLRITKQEFPYDIGIWNNIVQGMGTSNPLLWFLPWAPSRWSVRNDKAWEYETNDFEEPGESWPPPDPQKIPQEKWRKRRDSGDVGCGGVLLDGKGDDQMVVNFRRRQQQDYERKGLREANKKEHASATERDYDWLEMDETDDEIDETQERPESDGEDYGGRQLSTNRLAEFGVDEEDSEDEDDVPLAELIRRRKAYQGETKADSV